MFNLKWSISRTVLHWKEKRSLNVLNTITSYICFVSALCLTTESCDIAKAGKCLLKAAKDGLALLPKFIKKPGPACE